MLGCAFERFAYLVHQMSFSRCFHDCGRRLRDVPFEGGRHIRRIELIANDMATQVLLSQLPLLFAPRTDRVFVVGWGSGVSVGSAARTATGQVTAVELEPAVVEGSAFFRHVNLDPLRNPRVRLYEDDARHILVASDDRYDVVLNEPSHPWVAGVANLFTRDYYELVARRL